MKKLIFTLAFTLCAVIGTNAQEVGQFWLGGSFGFWTEKQTGGGKSQTSYKVLPEVGYAINDDIGIGVALGYQSDKNGAYRFNSFAVSPFLRWAFLKGHFGGMFLDAGAGYTYGTVDDFDNFDNQTFSVGLQPGVAINVSQKVSLIGKFGFIGYRHTKESTLDYIDYYDEYEIDKSHTNSFGIDLNMSQLTIGAVIKF